MQRDIFKTYRESYDLLIVGGGINGASIANMAAYNGLKVCLLEKNDFASGTSSKSTKLLHGGLRYLENFEFDLVYEALRERHILLKSAPHLVKPLSFIIPVYKNDSRPLWMMKLGIWLYDLLSGWRRVGKHQNLSAKEIKKRIPTIDEKNLCGGVLYHDVQMNDARLCLENILSAKSQGADVFNYAEVKSFIKENNRTVGVVALDRLTQQELTIRAKKVVCAVGPWTDNIIEHEHDVVEDKVRTTKGIHIVYRGQLSKDALLIPTQNDKRIFFVIPWMGNSLIGTTDTDYKENPDAVEVKDEDIEYLFKEINRVFPSIDFNREDIIITFAGLRPLVHKSGEPRRVSRKHKIDISSSDIIYVMGGKYTTFRVIAEDCLKKIISRPLQNTKKKLPLYGGGIVEQGSEDLAKEFGLSLETVEHLIETYGTRARDVLALTKKDYTLKALICTCSPAIKAQIVYAVQQELAVVAEDIYYRRLGLIYRDCKTHNCRDEIKKMLEWL